MQDFLTDLYANAQAPLISALLLGLLRAIAPCPMTINITAMDYIGKDLSRRQKVFSNGIFYTLGIGNGNRRDRHMSLSLKDP